MCFKEQTDGIKPGTWRNSGCTPGNWLLGGFLELPEHPTAERAEDQPCPPASRVPAAGPCGEPAVCASSPSRRAVPSGRCLPPRHRRRPCVQTSEEAGPPPSSPLAFISFMRHKPFRKPVRVRCVEKTLRLTAVLQFRSPVRAGGGPCAGPGSGSAAGGGAAGPGGTLALRRG